MSSPVDVLVRERFMVSGAMNWPVTAPMTHNPAAMTMHHLMPIVPMPMGSR